jgi:hypothetical protein
MIILVCVVALMFTACAPTPELRNDDFLHDTSYIDSDPCGPPCWRGITPGETNWNDALTIVEDDPTLDNLETRSSDESDIVGAIWSEEGGEGCCQMYTEDGRTVDILILQTAPEATLGQAIEALGEPEYAVAEALSGDQGVFTLFYPEQRTLLYVFVAGEDGALSESSEVIGFGYVSPARMELLTLTNDLHAWEGYASYGDYMDSEFEVTPSVTLTPVPESE